jgi:pimeloyl-ACP methyl ester carboxylesterase
VRPRATRETAAPARRERDLVLRSGRLHVHCWNDGSRAARAVLCVPGLSSNARGFDRIAERLAEHDARVFAVDLRGRAHSETTSAGTYGWPAHARDVLDAAIELGVDGFDLIGHSMGAYVAMQAAADFPGRVDRLVLIDGVGTPERAALEPIGAGLRRLNRWHASVEAYVGAVEAAGIVRPWSDFWERFYRYELETRDDGMVRSRTSLAAVREDVDYGRRHRQDELWPRLRGPVLLVRAAVPLGNSGAFIVTAADRDRFAAEVPGARVVEIDANHFGVIADPHTIATVADFLTAEREPSGAFQ